jgi:hypothetical protein
LKVTYTEEAVADIVEALSISTNAIRLPPRSSMRTSRDASNVWPIGSLRGQSHGSAPVLSCGVGAVPPFRIYSSVTQTSS